MAAIIFDFDGTIADSFAAAVDLFQELAGRHEPIAPIEIERLRGLTLRQAAHELYVHPWKIPFLAMHARRLMTKRMHTIAIQPGLAEAIHQLQTAGHQLYITSSNSQRNIELCLKRHQLQTAFIKIYGSAGLLNKARVLKKVIRQNHLAAADSWYIGDEIRDIEAAHHAGLRSVAVGWGYNTPAVLKQHQPTKLVLRPAELVAAVEAPTATI